MCNFILEVTCAKQKHETPYMKVTFAHTRSISENRYKHKILGI